MLKKVLKEVGAYVATGIVFLCLLGLTAVYCCLAFILDIVDMFLDMAGL